MFRYYDKELATTDWIEENLFGIYVLHPAYNTAELGAALKEHVFSIRTTSVPRKGANRCWYYGEFGARGSLKLKYCLTEARAGLLIHLIKAEVITAEEANARISSA